MNIKGRKAKPMRPEGRVNTLLLLSIKFDSWTSWKSRLEKGKQVLPWLISISQSVFLREDIFLMNSGKNVCTWGSCEMLKGTKSSVVLHTFPYYNCALDLQLCTSLQRLSFQVFFYVFNRGFCSSKNSALKLKPSIRVKAWNPFKTNALTLGKPLPNFVILWLL